jgi:hypothetical protein
MVGGDVCDSSCLGREHVKMFLFPFNMVSCRIRSNKFRPEICRNNRLKIVDVGA